MGLSLEFLSGHQQDIVSALEDADLERLYDDSVTKAKADFSFHLEPDDLNLLSLSIGKHSRQEPLELREYLTVLVDEPDFGALAVSEIWLAYVAEASNTQAEAIAKDWINSVADRHNDVELQLDASHVEAVRALILLCQQAVKEFLEVMHVWFA
jgi:hypothetical protein